MNNGWQTKADVLRDLGEVNGRRTGAEELHLHVVAGERPPPVHHETPDEDEMSYFSGGHRAPAAGDSAEPDLVGISSMLKMVNDMDETVNDIEPMTLYRNRATDEIRISKLNPNAGEYVPGNTYTRATVYSPNKNNNKRRIEKNTRNENVGSPHSNTSVNGIKQNGLPTFNNMFKSKSEKNDKVNVSNENTTKETESEIKNNKMTGNENVGSPHSNTSVNGMKQNGLPTFNNMFKSKSEKDDKVNITANENTTKATESEIRTKEVNPTKSNLLGNGLPKRRIEKQDLTKADEIKEIQEKIKSTIIASSTDNSLKTKRQKNVAIATLLKLGTVPSEPVKLMKPEYFEKPPINDKVNEKSENVPSEKVENLPNEKIDNKLKEVENLPSTSSSETNVNYLDQDSISKVDSWFSSMECPKPKPQLQEKLVLKDCITFKKKTASSVTSRNTSTTEDKESPKETKSFKPSAYANDLLKKYETNAQRQAPLIEDLGTRLERQLKERDEVVKQKMLARQNAG